MFSVSLHSVMGRKKDFIISELEITDIASEGKAVARHEGKVIFVKNAIPGDIADVKVYRSKSSFAEAEPIKFHSYSEKRVEPFCEHFGICGGCKWQNLNYQEQLFYKQKQVVDQLTRVGKVEIKELLPILGAEIITHYRNKLEYTFSSQRWVTDEEIASGNEILERNGVGFHIPGKFDKVLDVNQCWLQDDLSNQIRNEVKKYARENGISFFHLRNQEGTLRNLIVRNTTKGEWMLIFSIATPPDDKMMDLFSHIQQTFPAITSLQYVVNQKKNDTIHDLPVFVFFGNDHIVETLGSIRYRISPKSFFQTNSIQAKKLYDITKEFAGLTGSEIVYDLYTGTGSIACYIAANAVKVVGVEYVEDAIADAKINAELNGISNAVFFAGDMKDVLNDNFINEHGKPDVVITDPPRAGMHEDVIKKLMQIEPQKIVYVSCNPATQARDLLWLSEKYAVEKIQPVDMFPHTHHVENVTLLVLK